MKNEQDFPEITPLFDQSVPSQRLFCEIIRSILVKVLPDNLRYPAVQDPDLLDDQTKAFRELLPLFTTKFCDSPPGNISFFLLMKYRPNAFKFFFEMISHWMVPGKRLNVVLFHAVDFGIPAYGGDLLTLCEIMIHVENRSEIEQLQRNLPILQSEVKLGVESAYYARRILEIKGLSVDEKTAMIQEYVTRLMRRFPQIFDYDLLTEMQHVLVMCKEEFKNIRDSRHLGRIINANYLFRKSLRVAVKQIPNKRHLNLKVFHTHLKGEDGPKSILGMIVGINFLDTKELFEEKHLLSAIHNYIPTARSVEGSFFSNRRGNEAICTLYLEIEKPDKEAFTTSEIKLLRRELPSDLKDRIEYLMHPIFMPTNEEEIMRNILSLSNQIRFLYDLPQITISFEEQTPFHLIFTVILVKINKQGSPSFKDSLVQHQSSLIQYEMNRTKVVGYLRKKYPKEASVLKVRLPKMRFLRKDHSIDLNRARQAVFNELGKIVKEELRDFNGGMISKQHEVLCTLHEQLSSIKYNELLLENFFYSLTPDVMRTVVDPNLLKRFFLLLMETIEQGFFSGENYLLKIYAEAEQVFVMIKTEDLALKEKIRQALNSLALPAGKLTSSFVSIYDTYYIGYVYLNDQPHKQQLFTDLIKNELNKLKSPQTSIENTR